jgi:hypothetical protein
MATGKDREIGRVLVDAHWHVTSVAAGGECTVVASPAGPPFVCGVSTMLHSHFSGCILCSPVRCFHLYLGGFLASLDGVASDWSIRRN